MSRNLKVLASLVVLVGLAVGVGAAVDSPTMPYSETVSVDNSTSEISVVAENISSVNSTTTEGVLDVTVSGNESGVLTQVGSGTLDTSGENFTDEYTYSGVNATKYGNYTVEVSGDGVESLTVSTMGAGGGFLSGSSGGVGIVGGIIVVVLVIGRL
jgi:hypothetical protein